MRSLLSRKAVSCWNGCVDWFYVNVLRRRLTPSIPPLLDASVDAGSVSVSENELKVSNFNTSSPDRAKTLSLVAVETLRIDAINTSLSWNVPIVELIKNTCYEIKFDQHSIEVFLNGGFLINDIEFSKAWIGKYNLNNIQNERFLSITFEICSALPALSACLELWASTNVTVCLKGNQLIFKYTGNTIASSAVEPLTAQCSDRYIDVEQLFNSDIRTIRNFAKMEYRVYSHQKYYDYQHDQCSIYLKRVRLRGFKDVEFSASFDFSENKITTVEALLGSSLVQIKQIIDECNNVYGPPICEEWSESQDCLYEIVWNLNQLAIEICRCSIPRAEPEQYRYELRVQNITSWRKSREYFKNLFASMAAKS